jgi:hypothetical protein
VAEADHALARENPEVSHERSDVNVRVIAGFAAGLVIVAVVVHIALYWLLKHYEKRAAGTTPPMIAPTAGRETPPPPRLQVSPQADLAELRAAEEEQLKNYGWVDKERKIARIPIDRAMELIAQRGLPAREEPGGESRRQARKKMEAGDRKK